VRTPPSISRLPPAPPEAAHTRDVWVSLGVATLLFLVATTIALWPAGQDAKIKHKSAAPTLSMNVTLPGPPSQAELSEVENLPTRFTNPFDASEVFEFPPGTPTDSARESVAEVLLERARERRVQIRAVKHVHDRRPAPTPIRGPTLLSESLFKNAT
jgi:hypothetical protein